MLTHQYSQGSRVEPVGAGKGIGTITSALA